MILRLITTPFAISKAGEWPPLQTQRSSVANLPDSFNATSKIRLAYGDCIYGKRIRQCPPITNFGWTKIKIPTINSIKTGNCLTGNCLTPLSAAANCKSLERQQQKTDKWRHPSTDRRTKKQQTKVDSLSADTSAEATDWHISVQIKYPSSLPRIATYARNTVQTLSAGIWYYWYHT